MNAHDFVLGIDLGGTKMALATASASGAVIHQRRLGTQAERGAEQAMSRALEAGCHLVEQTRAETGGTLAGVGVITMGITLEDRVLMAPNVPGWERLVIPTRLRQAFPDVQVRVENDVKGAAWGELRWGALSGIDTGIYLNLGTGIAAALVVGGRVVQGAHGAAGEIGYNLRHLHEEAGAGADHAPLEEYAGGRAIGERAARWFGRPYTAQEVFQAAAEDVAARAFMETTLTEITFHVTNLAIALDPERLVVGGGLLGSKELVLPRLAAHLRRFVPFPPEVVAAHFVRDAGLMGAIAVALDVRG